MIRKGRSEDLDRIQTLVNRAKQLMTQEGNDQWDETYPTRKHYEDDLHNGQLYVYEMVESY